MQLEVNLITPPRMEVMRRNRRPFIYKPLPSPTSIRLLKIDKLQHVRDDIELCRPIFCSLIVKDLNRYFRYDALSYTWGDPSARVDSKGPSTESSTWSTQPFEIHCNGRSITVTTNLHSALLALRYYRTVAVGVEFPQISEYIWIDQICINQADTAERSSQVKLMGRIYRKAHAVQVWLGGHDIYADHFQYAMECLAPLYCRGPESYLNFKIFQSRSYDELGVKPISPKHWRGVATFFCRAWFGRCWIVQEVALASFAYVFCGLKVMRLDSLLMFWIFLADARWFQQLYCDPIIEMQNPRPAKLWGGSIFDLQIRLGVGDYTRQYAKRGKFFSLLELVHMFRYTKATDPRDKIYAFVSVSREFQDSAKISIITDYGKSVENIYAEVTRFFISSDGWNLSCFSVREDKSRRRNEALPSWILDFSVEWAHNPLVSLPIRWSAGAPSRSSKVQYLSPHTIKLHGMRIDTVRCLGNLHVATTTTGQQQEDMTSGEMLNMLTDELIQVLRQLPETYIIEKPPESQKSCEPFPIHNRTLESSQHSLDIPATSNVLGDSYTYQSRFEVFWRTILHDFYHDHPAPEICGRAIIEDIEWAFYMKLEDALSYRVPKVSCTRTSYVDWKYRIERVGKDYTILQTLQGSHPYQSDHLLYPPGFKAVMKSLWPSWNNVENVKDPERVAEYCDMVKNRVRDFSTPTKERLLVRQALLMASVDRVLFATQKGRIGTGLLSTKIEDEVWLLTGCPVPCILRPVGNERYTLVGEAYVHGVMHGEALKGANKEAFREVVIV